LLGAKIKKKKNIKRFGKNLTPQQESIALQLGPMLV